MLTTRQRLHALLIAMTASLGLAAAARANRAVAARPTFAQAFARPAFVGAQGGLAPNLAQALSLPAGDARVVSALQRLVGARAMPAALLTADEPDAAQLAASVRAALDGAWSEAAPRREAALAARGASALTALGLEDFRLLQPALTDPAPVDAFIARVAEKKGARLAAAIAGGAASWETREPAGGGETVAAAAAARPRRSAWSLLKPFRPRAPERRPAVPAPAPTRLPAASASAADGPARVAQADGQAVVRAPVSLAFREGRLLRERFVEPDLSALEPSRQADYHAVMPALGRLPGPHGGHLLVVRLPEGPVTDRGGGDPRGDPRWMIEALGENAARYFGFRTFRSDDGLMATIPDPDEFIRAVEGYNRHAAVPIRKSFYASKGKVSDADYIERIVQPDRPAFPIAEPWDESQRAWSYEGKQLAFHDVFHMSVILESDSLLERSRGFVRAARDFREFLQANHPEQAAYAERAWSRSRYFDDRDVSTFYDNLSGLTAAWFPEVVVPRVLYTRSDEDKTRTTRQTLDDVVLGSRLNGLGGGSARGVLESMIRFNSANDPEGHAARRRILEEFLATRDYGPALSRLDSDAFQAERLANRDAIRSQIASWTRFDAP
ncbi:MAG: hypothetical protein SF051_08935 [Elusimicrobiota bacterium]|nr:hypothetical protein [Elusimicrobiota bacterium]